MPPSVNFTIHPTESDVACGSCKCWNHHFPKFVPIYQNGRYAMSDILTQIFTHPCTLSFLCRSVQNTRYLLAQKRSTRRTRFERRQKRRFPFSSLSINAHSMWCLIGRRACAVLNESTEALLYRTLSVLPLLAI